MFWIMGEVSKEMSSQVSAVNEQSARIEGCKFRLKKIQHDTAIPGLGFRASLNHPWIMIVERR